MDESALLAQLKSLESSWALLDSWLKFWIALVVVGVATEVVVIIIEYRHERHAFSRGIIHPPDKPSLVLFAFGLLGAGLVAIGVAGEFGIHIKAGKVEAGMREANRQLVALVNQRAEDAGVLAAQLRKDAEGERLARVEIEDSVAWRRLTDKQKTEIGEKLHPLIEGESASVWYIPGDAEGAMFASDITEALRGADLPTQPPNIIGLQQRTPSSADFNAPIEHSFLGVWVGSISDRHSRALADATAKELSSRGFDTRRQDFTGPENGIPARVWVAVNPRPLGAQGEAKLRAEAKKRQNPNTQSAKP